MPRIHLDIDGPVTVARNNKNRLRITLGHTGIGVVLTPRQAIALANQLVDVAEQLTRKQEK